MYIFIFFSLLIYLYLGSQRSLSTLHNIRGLGWLDFGGLVQVTLQHGAFNSVDDDDPWS